MTIVYLLIALSGTIGVLLVGLVLGEAIYSVLEYFEKVKRR